MKSVAAVLLGAAVLYGVVVAAFYFFQRTLLFPAPGGYVPPAALGLPFVREAPLDTPDGARVMVWRQDAAPGKPTVLYFHGNGDSLMNFADDLRLWHAAGWGAAVVSYRSYPGSSGRPSERALMDDAALAYDALTADGIAPQDIVLAGYSLGSAVAADLAGRRKVRALILLGTISGADDIAKRTYPFLPVRTFMTDPFRTIDRIGAIDAPVFFVHGAADRLARLEDAQLVYDAAPSPKQMLVLQDAGHLLPAHAGWPEFQAFLKANTPPEA